MSEPKKETVRIVLPPRRDGQPLASNPRETAMINLPPKPMQKPGAPESVSAGEPPAFPPVPKPPGLPSFAPKAPPVVGLSAPPAAPKPLDFRSGAPRSQTTFRSARCSEAAFRGGSPSWRSQTGSAAARSEAAGHGNAVGAESTVRIERCRLRLRRRARRRRRRFRLAPRVPGRVCLSLRCICKGGRVRRHPRALPLPLRLKSKLKGESVWW